MYKKTITFEDYNGVTKTEDFFFNLTKTEIIKMERKTEGGMIDRLKKIINTKDTNGLMDFVEELINLSYGIKTPNGGFRKNPTLTEDFISSPAYDELYMELMSTDDSLSNFIQGVFPRMDGMNLNDAEIKAKAAEMGIRLETL